MFNFIAQCNLLFNWHMDFSNLIDEDNIIRQSNGKTHLLGGVCLKIKGSTYISSWLFTKTFHANMAGSLQGHGETDTSAGCGLEEDWGLGGSTRAEWGPPNFGNIEVLYLEKAIRHFQGSKKSNKRFRWHPSHCSPSDCSILYALDSQPKHLCFGSACFLGWYIAWKLMDSLCVKKHLQTAMSENADHKSSSFDSS